MSISDANQQGAEGEDLTFSVAREGFATRRAEEWALLAVALAPAVALGGNRPALWAPMAAAALALSLWRARRMAAPEWAAGLFLAALSWAAAQAALGLSADPDATWRAAARMAAYGAIFALAAGVARRRGGARRLTVGLALWVAGLSGLALAAWAAGRNPLLGAAEAYPAALEGSFINRNAFALYAGFGLLAALALAAEAAPGAARVRLRRLAEGGWIWPAAAAVCLAALLATGSRGGVAATAAGGAVLLLRLLRPRLALAGAGALALCAAGAALLFTAERAGPGLAAEARWEIHALVLGGIGEAPLTGHGFGAFQDAFRPLAAGDWRWGDWDHAHQMYLETAFELGLPAALALFGAFAVIGWRLVRAAGAGAYPALALAALVAAAAHSLVDFSVATPAVAAALALLLGLGWARAAP